MCCVFFRDVSLRSAREDTLSALITAGDAIEERLQKLHLLFSRQLSHYLEKSRFRFCEITRWINPLSRVKQALLSLDDDIINS